MNARVNATGIDPSSLAGRSLDRSFCEVWHRPVDNTLDMIEAIPGRAAPRRASSNTLRSAFILGCGTPIYWSGGAYFITSPANLRRCIAAWRRRKQAIQDMAVVEIHARVQP
jgi:hypothetical protein